MSSSHFLSLLGRLEELITKSPRVAGRAFLVIDEALEILKKIRVTLPTEVKAAEEIIQQKEGILREAREEADRLVSRSSKEAQRILSEHHLLKLAQEESKEIKAKAYSAAQQAEVEADRYVQAVLGRLEENLLQALKVVHEAREDFTPAEAENGSDEENRD